MLHLSSSFVFLLLRSQSLCCEKFYVEQRRRKIKLQMPSSILLHLTAILAVSYAMLDRPQVVSMSRMFGYGLGRSVGMLRNYRQNAEKLVRANPNGQKGVMGTMKDLDVVAREIRMAIWMARPGAMMRMGPMGGMGMTITPPPSQQSMLQGQPSQTTKTAVVVVDGDEDMISTYEGGSDLLVSSWRNGTERTKVRKRT